MGVLYCTLCGFWLSPALYCMKERKEEEREEKECRES